MEQVDFWAIEREAWDAGHALVCGADEAGAGPLAGAVYGAAVILPPGLIIEGLNDSKKVPEKRRERLFDQIREVAVAYCIEAVDVDTIEEINILNSRVLAMNRAIAGLNPTPDMALIDGNYDKGISFTHKTVVKGDQLSANIAAASILAKVSRDRYMLEMAKLYPEYEFHRHKGYGTALHFEKLRQYGPCPIHRPSFLKKL